jgi:hypothetical protein
MFNLVDDKSPLLTRRGIPLGIYWGVTGLGFVLLLIILWCLNHPIFVFHLMDRLINLIPSTHIRTSIQKGRIYDASKKRSDDMIAKSAKKKAAGGGGGTDEEKPEDDKETPEQLSHQAKHLNGKSTSSDGSSHRERKSSSGWLHRGRATLCCGDNV